MEIGEGPRKARADMGGLAPRVPGGVYVSYVLYARFVRNAFRSFAPVMHMHVAA